MSPMRSGADAAADVRKFGRGRVLFPIMSAGRFARGTCAAGPGRSGERRTALDSSRHPRCRHLFRVESGLDAFTGVVQFRVRGRRAELWDAVDGSRSPVDYSMGEQTTGVRLDLRALLRRDSSCSAGSSRREILSRPGEHALCSTL